MKNNKFYITTPDQQIKQMRTDLPLSCSFYGLFHTTTSEHKLKLNGSGGFTSELHLRAVISVERDPGNLERDTQTQNKPKRDNQKGNT